MTMVIKAVFIFAAILGVLWFLIGARNDPAHAGWATPDGPGAAAFQSDAEIRAELTRPRIYVIPPAPPAPTITECITPRGVRIVGQPATTQCITAPLQQ